MVQDPLRVRRRAWFIGDPLALLLPLLLISCSSIGMDHLLAMDFARLHGGVSIFLAAKLEFNLTAMKSMISKPRKCRTVFRLVTRPTTLVPRRGVGDDEVRPQIRLDDDSLQIELVRR